MPTTHGATHRLHYQVLGPSGAPPVLLIMGLGLSSRAWSDLPARLSDRYRVITFDNRGTGRSTRPPGLVSMRHMADDAARVLEAAGGGPAHVFGVSMGGMIAQELALGYPERVRTLALGCTYASWLRSRRPSLSVMRDLLGGILVRRQSSMLKLASILISAEQLAREPERFLDWMKGAEPSRPMLTMLQMHAIAWHGTEARLDAIEVPTLIITGKEDRLVPPDNSRRLARRIRGAELVELPGAGHCFPFERPLETAAALTRFWDAAARSKAATAGQPR